jgi:NitT/TauT family transport system permease protein
VPQRSRAVLHTGMAPVAAALAVFVIAWWPLAFAFDPFLPSPLEVAQAIATVTTDGELYKNFRQTLTRIAVTSVTAFLVGSVLAILMARNRIVDFVALPWVLVGLSTPSAAAGLAAILFLGISEVASLLALLFVVTPYVINVVFQGARSIDPKLLEVAQVYRLSTYQRLRQIMIPYMAPSLLAGARLAFALSWKSIVIIEALTRPHGIGAELTYFFRTLRPENVLAYTLCFSVVMLAVEILVFRTMDRRAFRWRKSTAAL